MRSRRRFLHTLSFGATAALAGCGALSSSDGGDDSTETGDDSTELGDLARNFLAEPSLAGLAPGITDDNAGLSVNMVVRDGSIAEHDDALGVGQSLEDFAAEGTLDDEAALAAVGSPQRFVEAMYATGWQPTSGEQAWGHGTSLGRVSCCRAPTDADALASALEFGEQFDTQAGFDLYTGNRHPGLNEPDRHPVAVGEDGFVFPEEADVTLPSGATGNGNRLRIALLLRGIDRLSEGPSPPGWVADAVDALMPCHYAEIQMTAGTDEDLIPILQATGFRVEGDVTTVTGVEAEPDGSEGSYLNRYLAASLIGPRTEPDDVPMIEEPTTSVEGRARVSTFTMPSSEIATVDELE